MDVKFGLIALTIFCNSLMGFPSVQMFIFGFSNQPWTLWYGKTQSYGSTICISFLKYAIFHCFDIFWFVYFVCKCLSILELSGWRFPPSSREVLELSVAFEQLNFSGICSFLESSLDLETLVIKWDHESETVSFF